MSPRRLAHFNSILIFLNIRSIDEKAGTDTNKRSHSGGSLHAQTSASAAKALPISPKAVKDLLASGKEFVLLDVRTFEEFVASRIQGSVLLPYDQITAATAAKTIGAKDKTVVVYCRTGHRSGIAAATLVSLGYTKVLDMGGILSWPYATIAGEPKKP